MCGTDVLWMASTATPTPRALRRNVSTTSSCAANNYEAAAMLAVKEVPEQQEGDQAIIMQCPSQLQDGWPCDILSPRCTSSSAVQPCLPDVQQPVQPPQLLLGTSAGLFVVNLQTQSMQLLGLQDIPVGHVCYNHGLVLASCPFLEDTNNSRQQQADAAALAGLYCLKHGSSSFCNNSTSFADSSTPTTKLWQGNARCAAFATGSSTAVPKIYLGMQPADVLCSDDMGLSWSSSGLADTPQAGSWYRMLPPYEPSVRSISVSSNSTGRSSISISSSGSSLQSTMQQEHQHVLVGVEVGGAMVHAPSSAGAAADSDCSNRTWVECSQGLCKDIQALQPDPFSTSRLYAVAGSGSLPGGLYRSRGKGQKWKRLFGYRYSVGMAVSCYQKGRMVLVSADKPPEIGFNLFDSTDGGRNWANMTDYVADAVNSLTGFAPGVLEHAPVAMFVPGGLVLGCVTGHVFIGQALPQGGYTAWRLLAKLPAAVNCMCMTDETVAPVALQRT